MTGHRMTPAPRAWDDDTPRFRCTGCGLTADTPDVDGECDAQALWDEP